MRNTSRRMILVGMMLLPTICHAQHGSAWRDSTRRLGQSVRALRDSLLQVDSTAEEIARRGDLAVAASPDQAAIAATVLNRFASVRDRWFGGAMPAAGGFRVLVSLANAGQTPASEGAPRGVIVISGLPDSGNAIRERTTATQGTAASMAIDRYGRMMIGSVPALSAWLENPPPLSTVEGERREQAMYAFVTATGPVQRRCVDGGLVACAVALKIRPVGEMNRGGFWSPFERADLMYFALDLGGAGAWQRLAATADSGISAGLAAAAGIPIDSLLGRWRTDLLARRPVAAVITPGSAILALGWTGILLLGALGVSKWA